MELARAAYVQSSIADVPVVIVCCADIKGYLEGTVSGAQDLGKTGTLEERIVGIIQSRVGQMNTSDVNGLGARIAVNVAFAIEHIVLRALDYDLGSCWVRLIDEQKIKEIFGWDDNIYVVVLFPVGYPAEVPKERKRLRLNDVVME